MSNRLRIVILWGAVVACGSRVETGGGSEANAGAAGLGSGGHAGAGEGGAGPVAPCTIKQPFGTPKPLAELNTAEYQAGPRLTPDELTIAYLSVLGSTSRLNIARRAKRSDAFGAPLIAIPSNAGMATISDDGLVVLMQNDESGTVDISMRDSVDVAFQQLSPLLRKYGAPYVVGGANGWLYLGAPLLTQTAAMYVTRLTAWKPGIPVQIPSVTPVFGAGPVVTPDQLTLYGSSYSDADDRDIWVRERASATDPFGPPTYVTELNTPEDDFVGWISPDNCRLYFDSGTTQKHDLFVAERVQ